jgi:hypothetical protein
MAISFADQVIAFLANPANQSQFSATVGLQAFAVTSFTRRYGQGGFQINGVTLGAPSDFRLQEFLIDGSRGRGISREAERTARAILVRPANLARKYRVGGRGHHGTGPVRITGGTGVYSVTQT